MTGWSQLNLYGFRENRSCRMTLEELEAKNKELQAALDKAGSGLDDEARKRLSHLESENKDLIGARDKAKAKAREAEDQKLVDNQEFKTLAETRQAELDALTTEQTKLNERLGLYEARDTARLEKLIEQVPEAQRPLIKDSFPLADRIELAESLAQIKPNAPNPRLPGEGSGDQPMTSVQKIAAGLAKL